MIIGMDFGTTNSGLAVADGPVRLLPLDPANPAAPHIVRTMLYITRGHNCFVGREAIDEYVYRNQGRPVRLRREYVGTISLTYADLGTFARDAYVWVDDLEPGRLFRSLKTYLPDPDYLGTSVWGQFYRLEDLVAAFLRRTRECAEQELGRPVEEVVLGRPVVFATDPNADRLAEERLARAAILAGYRRAYFQLEPIAAALLYLEQVRRPQRVLVFDFGGGTLDLAVLQVDQAGRQVLATGGVRIAGDVFDQRIVRARLARRLGEQVLYGAKRLAMPAYIYEGLCDWQALLLLNRPEVLQLLSEVERETDHPEQIRALHSLVRNNYGLMMFDRVEQGKIALSSSKETVIRLLGEDLLVEEPLTRSEFEQLIRAETRAIVRCLDDTLAAAGLEYEDVDAVVRTGGSSLIPLFQRMLRRKFGPEKVRPTDEFTSVTAGLAIAAAQIGRGETGLRCYSSEILTRGQLVARVELGDGGRGTQDQE
jgi:hypothetical chaperone protein